MVARDNAAAATPHPPISVEICGAGAAREEIIPVGEWGQRGLGSRTRVGTGREPSDAVAELAAVVITPTVRLTGERNGAGVAVALMERKRRLPPMSPIEWKDVISGGTFSGVRQERGARAAGLRRVRLPEFVRRIGNTHALRLRHH